MMDKTRIILNLEKLQEIVTIPFDFVEKKPRQYITKTMKTRVLNRDHHRCVICDREKQIRIHHIEPYGASTLKNLITLCHPCHEYIHKLLKKKGYPYFVPTIPLRTVSLR